MEFLRGARRRKSLASEVIYILLNVGLAVAVLLVVLAVNSPLAAFGLVLLSKWRVLAVRPRYWFAHIQANMVDLIVSLGFVELLYVAGGGGEAGLATQIVLTLFYILWLLLLKPRTKRSLVVAQAGVAIFIGVSSLYMATFGWPSSIVVLMMWVIGYSVARHVLAAYSEEHLTFMSFVWGLVFAELGWLGYHWTIAYDLALIPGIALPQIMIITLSLSFVAERAYNSFAQHDIVRPVDVVMPSLLSLSIIAIMLLAFNEVSVGAI